MMKGACDRKFFGLLPHDGRNAGLLLVALVALAPFRLQADADPSAGDQESRPITALETYTVSDVPVADQVLPTVRPVSDVTGDAESVLDIPRSVSSVNQAWLKDRMVQNAMDFGQFSAGVYSAAQFGIPGVPIIRGDFGQMYLDGQTMPYVRNSVPTSFNGVESMDIVKGPGSAIYGPQGDGTGGYVDLITKQPRFDRFRAEVEMTAGNWTSGHANGNPSFTLDFGGPVSDKFAYRVSYLSRYGDGYYLNDRNATQDIFLSLAYRPSRRLKIDYWVQYYAVQTTEVSGANRVSQQFIWNGSYLAGPAIPVTSGPNAYLGYDIASPGTSPSPSSYGIYADGTYSIVDPAQAHTVKLPAYVALVGPNDYCDSDVFATQTKETLELGPDSSLVNRTSVSIENYTKFDAYGYDEYVPRNESVQDRFEYHSVLETGPAHHQLIAGIDFRYQELISYQDYSSEPFSYYDLSQNLSNLVYPGYALEGNTLGGGERIPGRAGLSENGSNPDLGSSANDQWTHLYDSATFVQDTISLGRHFSALLGLRMDRMSADTANPPTIEVGYDAFFTYYPLTTPVYIPRGQSSPIFVDESAYGLGYHTTYQGFNLRGTANDPAYFGSFIYKPLDQSTLYLTLNKVDSVLGGANAGGVDVTQAHGVPQTSLANSLRAPSQLAELGYKQAFLSNRLLLTVSSYVQEKLGTQITGQSHSLITRGDELELVFQPNRRWTFNANASYLNVTANQGVGGGYFQQTGNYLDTYSNATVVDGKSGTGLGSPNFTAYFPNASQTRMPGVPQYAANGFLEYRVPSGWGFGVGLQFQGWMYANENETLHIPSECEVDGFASYTRSRWGVRLNLKNILNRRLVDPVDASFAGNDQIFVRPPITASVTLRIKL